MFRFLIVEDIKATLDILGQVIEETFKDAIVDKALDVENGKRLLTETAAKKKTYDAVILDFKLPLKYGEYPETDESLCLLIRQMFPHAIVGHITAFVDDPEIKSHMKHYHGGDPYMPIGFTLGKTIGEKTNWFNELTIKLTSYLMQKKLNDICGPYTGIKQEADDKDSLGSFQSRNSINSVSRFSQTHILSEMVYQMNSLWPHMDTNVKDRIRQLFVVRESEDGKVSINVL